MATYTISTAVTAAGTAQPINTGDTVIVSSSGSLDSTAAAGITVSDSAGANGGFDTIRVAGTLRGATYAFEDSNAGGNDFIHVAESGHIFGGTAAAIYVEAGSNAIVNNGGIVDNDGGFAIELSGDGNSVTNAGTISASGKSAIYIAGQSNTLSNSGLIISGSQSGIDLAATKDGSGHNVVSNSGTISGADGINSAGDSSTITNSGTISVNGESENGGIIVHGDSNVVTNSGSITAQSGGVYASGVDLYGNSNVLTNSGTIAASAAGSGTGVYGSGSGNVIQNDAGGLISGSAFGIWITTGESTVIINSGQIQGGATGVLVEDGTNSHIKVLLGGSITGSSDVGINTQHQFENAGLFEASASLSGAHIIDKGIILGGHTGIALTSGSNVVKVSGSGIVTGSADYGILDGGEGPPLGSAPLSSDPGDHIFNAGTIQGGDNGISLGNFGSNHIHNSGNILGGSGSAIVIDSGGFNHITNQGSIIGAYGGVYIGGETGSNVVTNASGGIIKGIANGSEINTVGVGFGSGGNSVTNSGEILVATLGHTDNAAIYADAGSNTIVNNAGGLISDFHGAQLDNYAIQLFGGGNSVTNDGNIVGTVQIGTAGTNTYDGSAGHLTGTVKGGSGSDTIVLGAGDSAVIGNGGGDAITAGTGPDSLVYLTPGDSDVTGFDTVDGFKAGTDSFTFAIGGAFTGLASVTVGSLSGINDLALETAVAGHLDPYGAVALSVSTGVYAGDVFLIVDANGDSHFDDTAQNQDYLVVLTNMSGTLSASDIQTEILTG